MKLKLTSLALGACLLAGVDHLFQVGGAPGIAALCCGTATIPRVDKIVGAGDAWGLGAGGSVATTPFELREEFIRLIAQCL